jgi:tripartite-type tricarboxylate transporter receptor subunit TctC
MKTVTRRATVAGLGATTLFAPAIVRAQAYPGGQTIKMLVPYPAGGATDIVGRTIADALAAHWKSTVVVENVAGAAANVGMDRIAKGAADGTTLFVVPPQIAINQYLYARLNYDPEKDLLPISQISRFTNLLSIKKQLGGEIKSVKDLIDFAKKNPGKLNFASSGNGTTIHLSGELFKKMAGIDMVHVAYRGSAPALNDLVGGQVDLMFDNLPSVYPQAKAGNVIGLGVTSLKPSPFAPEYGTVAATVPGYEVESWFGVGCKAGTPAEIVAKVEADLQTVCKTDAVKERLKASGMETVGSNRAQFAEWIGTERKRWGTLISDLKLKVE